MKAFLYQLKFYIPTCLAPVEDLIEVKAESREVADDMLPHVVYEYLQSNWPGANVEEVSYLDQVKLIH